MRGEIVTKDRANKLSLEVRSIAIPSALWEQAKELAEREGRSVSSYFREQIKRLYKLKATDSKD